MPTRITHGYNFTTGVTEPDMFSDRYIPLKVLTSVIILLLFGAYSHQHGKSEDEIAIKAIRSCVTSPVSCVDQPLVLRIRTGNWSKGGLATAEVKAGSAYLSKHPIKVSRLVGKRSAGRIIDLLGSFDHTALFIVTRQREDDWIQTTKYLVSLAGLGLCLWFFTRLFNFSARWRLPLIPRQSKTNDA